MDSQKRCNIHQDKPASRIKEIMLSSTNSQMLWSILPAVASARRIRPGASPHINSKTSSKERDLFHLKAFLRGILSQTNSVESGTFDIFITIRFKDKNLIEEPGRSCCSDRDSCN